MAAPLRLLSVALEHIPEQDAEGSAYPWAKPLLALQTLVRDLAGKVNEMPWVASSTCSATFGAGDTKTLLHGLGRIPVRWAVEDVVDGYGSFQRSAWTATSITIQAENACSASFRVA